MTDKELKEAIDAAKNLVTAFEIARDVSEHCRDTVGDNDGESRSDLAHQYSHLGVKEAEDLLIHLKGMKALRKVTKGRCKNDG